MGVVESLGAWGVLRPAEVVAIARDVGLSLPAAATLLEKESGGGRNVWGSDPVATGGAYTKGGPVTEANYLAYRRHLAGGTAGAQGVGPCQLTWRGYQDAADRIGGCWRWECNVRVGFETLRDLQRQHGVRGGFRRYNGSGPMAEKYADDAMTKLQRWTDRLGAPTPTPASRPPAPDHLEDDVSWNEPPIPDRYAPNLRDLPSPREALAWATAHAAHARDRATEARNAASAARDELAATRAEIAELRADLAARPTAETVQIDYTALAAALLSAVAKGA